MPGNESEIPILVREFTGVDVQTDPAFLREDTLQAAQNLVPNFTYLLQKRQGTIQAGGSLPASFSDGLPWVNPRIDVLRWVLQNTGTSLIFYVVTTEGDGVTTAAGDRLMVNIGEPPVPAELYNFANGVDPTGAPLATSGARYGMTILGGKLYVGNGRNAIVTVDIESPTNPPIALTQLATFTNSAGAPTIVTSTTQTLGLVAGTYSYRWACLDSSGGGDEAIWTSQSQTQTFVVSAASALSIDFTGPSDADVGHTIDGAHTVHLFLSPPGFPIEYARDQGMIDTSSAHVIVTNYNDTSDLVPLQGASFTGRYLVRHRGRVWIAGDERSLVSGSLESPEVRSRLYATNVIVPGLEQQLYNYGDFFPSGASALIGGYDGDIITGIAVSQGGANRDLAFSPLVIFKNASTWLWFGDIVNDDTAALIQVSDQIGCASAGTIVTTSQGVIFMGYDSVYYLGSGFDEPIDIGIAIRPQIENIPKGRLPFATATYHRGFYKLAITPAGDQTNTIEWWYDLRPVPSSEQIIKQGKWWGPHVVTPFSCMTVATLDPQETERLYAGRECPPEETSPVVDVMITDQEGLFTDYQFYLTTGSYLNVPISSRLRTGGLLQNEPFQWKDWTSIRIVTLPGADSPVFVTVYADGGSAEIRPTMNQNRQLDDTSPTIADNIIYANSGNSLWDVALWDVGLWGARQFVEGWSELVPVIRSHSLEIEVTHNDPFNLLLRDLEVRYRPVQRRAPGAV